MLFKWNPYDHILEDGKRISEEMDENTIVYVHLSSDSFEADLMEKDEATGEFSLLRMVPPGQIEYYFSIAQPPLANQGQTSFTKSFLNHKMIDIPGTNILENLIQTRELITKTYLEDLSVIPRPPPKKIKGLHRVKTPWDFKKSVFKDYIPDNELILAKCFEMDWTSSKIPKIIKDEKEKEKVMNYLRSNYKYIREVYKSFAGISPCNGIPSIGTNTFQDIANSCYLIDGELLKLSDMDLEFISTNAGLKNQLMNPDRALVRY